MSGANQQPAQTDNDLPVDDQFDAVLTDEQADSTEGGVTAVLQKVSKEIEAAEAGADDDADDDQGDIDRIYVTEPVETPQPRVTEAEGMQAVMGVKPAAEPAAAAADKTPVPPDATKKAAPTPAEAQPAQPAADPGAEEPAQPAAQAAPGKAPAEKADAAAASGADLSAILEKLDEGDRKAVADRVRGADEVLALFEPHKDDLAKMGSTPQGAISYMLNLNRIANTRPDEYVAWVLRQTAQPGSDPLKVLGSVAKHLGITDEIVLKGAGDGDDDDDDDLFADPAVAKVREENQQLRKQVQALQPPPQIGPDNPQVRAEMALIGMKAERDSAGAPLYPHLDLMIPTMTQLAQARVQQTGQPITPADLPAFYAAACKQHGVQPTTPIGAAQPAAPPAQQKDSQGAAARASAASSILTGPGQGASPASTAPMGALDVPDDDISASAMSAFMINQFGA